MSGRIPQHFIDELVGRADIIDVIGTRVPLKKAGKEYKACCPFHDEKSPSFTVVPDKQFYHCFGCGAHGTALGFLMDYDHLSFVEAVEELAARSGMTVPREEDPAAVTKPADDLYTPLERAAALFQQQLESSERAIPYLKKRGLTSEIAARFGIGYAPDAWDFVIKHLGSSEAECRKLLQVGLVIEREQRGGYYDRFRDRIMFPIRDSRGRPIGFGGRILDQGEPKYLNSPETELFHKGKELYGLFEARQVTRSFKRLMVVEGYMDVVRLHQAGITYAVATLGTATTPEHLTRIFRVCSEVVFCFDGDRAGRAAAWRALENSLPQVREGRQIRFLFLPEGHDPDSLVGEEGREVFEKRLDTALALSDYFIRELSSRCDSTVDGRAQLAEMAKPLVQKIVQGVYRELLIDALAKVVGMPTERLLARLDGNVQPAHPSHAGREISQALPLSAGRRNLVRQAIHLLVHFPNAALPLDEIPGGLTAIDRPGVPLLLELLANLQAAPCPSTGALLERWRDRPDHVALAKLAQLECSLPDAKAASKELAGALERLLAEEQLRRTDELLNKHAKVPLTDAENQELQRLLRTKASSSRAAQPP
ncbi:MAG: DNA primase [Candidatus Obscuribacterales bacterium]|nr:DNA primase [Steroidobacteraceae bacterium]